MILSAVQFIKKPVNIISVFNIIDVIFLTYLLLFVFFSTILPRDSFSWSKIFINIFNILINIILFPLIYLSQLINEIKARFNLVKLNNIFESFLNRLLSLIWAKLLNRKNKSSQENNRRTYISINRIYDDLPFLGISFMGIVIFLLYIVLKIGDNPLTPELDGYVYLIIKNNLSSLISSNVSILSLLVVIVPVSIFFTEVISNTTIIIIMFSMIGTLAPTLNINPIFLMLAVTVSSTATFMSPIASPVNAVTYGSIKGISLKEMFYKGLLLNIISSIWIIIVFYFLNL
jgi:sodium-dependent dicarboxylate transporter 2/3/5